MSFPSSSSSLIKREIIKGWRTFLALIWPLRREGRRKRSRGAERLCKNHCFCFYNQQHFRKRPPLLVVAAAVRQCCYLLSKWRHWVLSNCSTFYENGCSFFIVTSKKKNAPLQDVTILVKMPEENQHCIYIHPFFWQIQSKLKQVTINISSTGLFWSCFLVVFPLSLVPQKPF